MGAWYECDTVRRGCQAKSHTCRALRSGDTLRRLRPRFRGLGSRVGFLAPSQVRGSALPPIGASAFSSTSWFLVIPSVVCLYNYPKLLLLLLEEYATEPECATFYEYATGCFYGYGPKRTPPRAALEPRKPRSGLTARIHWRSRPTVSRFLSARQDDSFVEKTGLTAPDSCHGIVNQAGFLWQRSHTEDAGARPRALY